MTEHEEGATALLPNEVVYEFPTNYFVENIAVRPTGQLLVTVFNTCELYQVTPNGGESAACLVHHFSAGVAGIIELGTDVFYVSSGSIGEKGSFAIFKVDMSHFRVDASGKVVSPATVTKAIDMPDALFLNGSTVLSHSKGLILAADSIIGGVFCVDISASKVKLWLQDKALEKTAADTMLPGINGIKIFDHYLYMSSTEAATFLRIRISEDDEPAGNLELVADKCNIDDFAFDTEGSAYLTSHVFNSVFKLQRDGTRSRIAGGPEDTDFAGTTAIGFGRTEADRDIIYVTTNGGMSLPVNGKVEPGKVLKVKVGFPGLAI